jgi:FPC/CPF motif-containing protein YcgG
MASADPEQPDFSFSFAGTSYFVAALSPVSPRMSRQFMIPALIFNAHYQFAAMRAKGTFNALRDRIRDKDTALENGIRNPLAAGFGEGAGGTVQYCGIPPAPGTQWKCPFHRNPKPEIK